MLYLKCTGIVQKALGLPKTLLADAEPTSAPLGNWYVNRFDVGRRKAHVFMSETTLLSFILLQGKTPVTPEGVFAKTDSRPDLGSLNDLAQRYQWMIECDGGLDRCDLTRIIMGTNNMPQRRLGWCSSWDMTQSKLQLLS